MRHTVSKVLLDLFALFFITKVPSGVSHVHKYGIFRWVVTQSRDTGALILHQRHVTRGSAHWDLLCTINRWGVTQSDDTATFWSCKFQSAWSCLQLPQIFLWSFMRPFVVSIGGASPNPTMRLLALSLAIRCVIRGASHGRTVIAFLRIKVLPGSSTSQRYL